MHHPSILIVQTPLILDSSLFPKRIIYTESWNSATGSSIARLSTDKPHGVLLNPKAIAFESERNQTQHLYAPSTPSGLANISHHNVPSSTKPVTPYRPSATVPASDPAPSGDTSLALVPLPGSPAPSIRAPPGGASVGPPRDLTRVRRVHRW